MSQCVSDWRQHVHSGASLLETKIKTNFRDLLLFNGFEGKRTDRVQDSAGRNTPGRKINKTQ